jgi:SMI1-KNR4 cell-wall
MLESEIAQIETELALPLPSDYRKFLLTYPQVLIDTKLDFGWMQEAPADRQLCNNPTQV